MTKWVTIHKEYKNEGVEIIISCERANIKSNGFANWDQKVEDVEQELYKQIEKEVLGGPIEAHDLVLTHYSNRDLKNLIVTQCLSYPKLDLKVEQKTDKNIKPHQAKQKAFEKLTDLIWDKKIKDRKQVNEVNPETLTTSEETQDIKMSKK